MKSRKIAAMQSMTVFDLPPLDRDLHLGPISLTAHRTIVGMGRQTQGDLCASNYLPDSVCHTRRGTTSTSLEPSITLPALTRVDATSSRAAASAMARAWCDATASLRYVRLSQAFLPLGLNLPSKPIALTVSRRHRKVSRAGPN